jgi:hypothetical protein
MNAAVLLSFALACTSALSLPPTQAQVSSPIDLDKIHGPVYVIQDPKTGTTYILVPKGDEGYSPVRGVTYWA